MPDMHLRAHVKIGNGTFEDWENFFNSYSEERSKYVKNEKILKINDQEAEVDFEVTDIDGLTALSGAEEIVMNEERLGVVTTLL